MATYAELKQLEGSATLLGQVEVAIWKSIATISTEGTGAANHAVRVGWAINAIRDTKGEAVKILRLALATNASATVSQINSATDTSIQTIVDNSIALLAGL